MFRLALDNWSVGIVEERHYRLVQGSDMNRDYIRATNTMDEPLLID
jgi:hypothetical protein